MVKSHAVLKTLAIVAAATLVPALPAWSQKKTEDLKRGAAAVQTFLADGIHVILSPADNEIVSVIVGLEGGFASNETPNPALTEFTADVIAASGSGSVSKEELRRFLAQSATSINGGGDYRGLSFSMSTTLPNFDGAWDVLASMVTDPRFDPVEYHNLQQRRIAEVKRRWSNPESQASIIADSLVQLGHPTLGRSITQEDFEGITIPMMQEFIKRVTERSRILVVVVGKVTQQEIERKLAAFSSLPPGSYKPAVMQPQRTAAVPTVVTVDRPGPTTYVRGAFAGPRADDADYWPLAVGLSHLRNILFEEVRTKRNLSYAPGSSLTSTLGDSRGVISVSSTLPDSAIVIMLHELEKMRNGEIDEQELNNSKQVYTTAFYMRQTTNGGLANALYSAQHNAGNWKQAFSQDDIAAVNRAGVQRAFEKYARNLQFGIVGNQAKVTRDRYVFR